MRPTFQLWLQGGGMRGPQGGEDGSIRGAPIPSFMGPYSHLYDRCLRGHCRVKVPGPGLLVSRSMTLLSTNLFS